jgi:hypothetical protein
MRDAAKRHVNPSLPYIAGNYMGEHWFATLTWLALEAAEAE